jgi:hypothetical protein
MTDEALLLGSTSTSPVRRAFLSTPVRPGGMARLGRKAGPLGVDRS